MIDPRSESEAWKKSRSGAWAGRGFHYQHLVTTLILVRQWAGLMPPGHLVPEGSEDCVLELSDRRVWIQIKSRRDTPFRETEVYEILGSINAKGARLPNAADIRPVVVLEQLRSFDGEVDIAQMFDDDAGCVFVSRSPAEEIVQLLATRFRTAEVIAEGLAYDLYWLVAGVSAENASLSFSNRRRISPNDVDRRIFERLEAEDPSAIDHALRSGALEPVDLSTPLNDPGFYRGVKVKPGHIAANLVLNRPIDVDRLLDILWKRRHVLVSGPSGAGKSALVWLATAAAAIQVRWYRITSMATEADAEAIVRFVRARRPSKRSPLGLVLDEVASANSDLWNVLARELKGLPELYFLGSVRQEDIDLVMNRTDTAFFPVSLGEELARAVWEELAARDDTDWTHWREPFEQSGGLMLEFIHLLTQGQRLAAVIGDQIRQRERERRNDELKIVRGAAVLCAKGGEVDASTLFELLELTPEAANLALKRLITEHLVRESRPGVLGGLHALRTDALVTASHDGIVFDPTDTLWRTLPATTSATLPGVVRSVVSDFGDHRQPQSLRNLAEILGDTRDIHQWTAILTGLGLATLDRHVSSFMSILDRHGLERAHWSLASAYADPSLEIPDLSASDQWACLRRAVLEFRALPKHDLRAACLANLPAGTVPPRADCIAQANQFLSSIVPICGGDPIRIPFCQQFLDEREPDIHQLARLLSTAYLIHQDLAESLVETLGGEQVLFDLFHSQVPWTTPPEIETDGQHGRTVRANWYQVAERYQPDPNDTVSEICETLIALSPRSDGAASDAIDPKGRSIKIGDLQAPSKNIPRGNLPGGARVAWNVAFRQILLARSAADSLTDYAREMARLLHATETIFRATTEKWIRAKGIPNSDTLTSEINSIQKAVNALAYAAPEKAPSSMAEPPSPGTPDTLGSTLTGVLGNLIGRLSKLDAAKSAATFAGSLHDQAQAQLKSPIWRTMSSPPLTALKELSDRLSDVSCILHELAYDRRPDAVRSIVKTSRKARGRNSVRAAARHCLLRARRRFDSRIRELENALASRGWLSRCLSRPTDESDSPYWPAREVAVLLEIKDFKKEWFPAMEELLSIATKHLDNDWPFRAVPVMNGQILASLAVFPTSHKPLPDHEFDRKWADFVDQPIFSSVLLDTFQEATDACMQVSAIVNSRGVLNLHIEENEVLSRVIDTFNDSREIIETAANQTETEHFALALDYLDLSWAQVVDELEAINAGRKIEDPLGMTPYSALAGRQSEHLVDITSIRLALLQAECRRLAPIRDSRGISDASDEKA